MIKPINHFLAERRFRIAVSGWAIVAITFLSAGFSFAAGGVGTLKVADRNTNGESTDNDRQKPKLAISLLPSRESASKADVNSGSYFVTLRIENISDQELKVWPFIELEIQAIGKGNVKQTRNIGRWGRLNAPSKIEAIKFLTLKPGAVHEIKFGLDRFDYGVRALKGWSLSPGKYQLEVSYSVDQAKLKKRLGKRCKTLDDPEKPWNQVEEFEWKKKVELRVTR